MQCSLILPLNVVNMEVLGKAHTRMRSQAMGTSAAASVPAEGLPPTSIARSMQLMAGCYLPRSINGFQDFDLIGRGAL